MESLFKVFKVPSKKEAEKCEPKNPSKEPIKSRNDSEEDLFQGMDIVKETEETDKSATLQSALVDIRDLDLSVSNDTEKNIQSSSEVFSFLEDDDSDNCDTHAATSALSFLDEDEEKGDFKKESHEIMTEEVQYESTVDRPTPSACKNIGKGTKRRKAVQPGFANQKSHGKKLTVASEDQPTSLCSETDVPPVMNMNLVEESNDHTDTNKIKSWPFGENIESYDSRKEDELEDMPDISNLEIEESLNSKGKLNLSSIVEVTDNGGDNEGCKFLSEGTTNNDPIMEYSKIPVGIVMSTEKTVKEKRSLKENNLGESKISCRDNFSQKPLTDFQNLKLQLDLLKARENEIRQSIKSYHVRQSVIIDKWKNEKLSEEAIIEKIDKLQEKQDEYEQNENYDEAIEVSRNIQILEEQYENYRFQHPVNSSDVTELISGYLQTYTMMQQQQNEVLKSYEDLHKEHSSKPRKSNEISEDLSQKQILAVKEVILKLERSLSHLRLDKEHLRKNEVILNEEISKKTRDHNVEKHLLVEKRRKVQNEILALREQLAKLEEEESFYSSEIGDIESAVGRIVEEFRPKIEQIEKEKYPLENEEKKLENEMRTALAKEKDIEMEIEEKSKEKKEYAKSLDDLKSHIEELKTGLGDEIPPPIESIINISHVRRTVDQKYTSAKNALKLSKEELEVQSSKLFEEETKQRNLQRAVNDIETQLAELQKIKQVTVKERNYKEAKRLSEEIKELTSCGENKQRDIEELIPQIKDRKNEIERLQKKISIEEKTCGELKYAQDNQLLHSLVETVKDIEDFLQKYPDVWIKDILQLELEYCKNIIVKLETVVKINAESDRKTCSTFSSKLPELEAQLKLAEIDENWELAESLNIEIEDLKRKM